MPRLTLQSTATPLQGIIHGHYDRPELNLQITVDMRTGRGACVL